MGRRLEPAQYALGTQEAHDITQIRRIGPARHRDAQHHAHVSFSASAQTFWNQTALSSAGS